MRLCADEIRTISREQRRRRARVRPEQRSVLSSKAKPLETCALPCVRVVALVVDVLVEWRFLVVWVCVVVFVQGAAEEVLREATR